MMLAPVVVTSFTVGGYIETYYQLNVRAPSNHITNLRGFDNRDRSFSISNVALDGKGQRGPVSARIILQVGSTPSTYYQAEPDPDNAQIFKYVQQASLAYTTGPTVIDAGLFPSPIGPEVLPVKDNWNWSRSDLFFALPFYHAGARVARQLGGGWTAMLHVYNGWNSVVDNNAYPSAGLSAGYASKRINGQVLYLGGIERPTGAPEGQAWRHLFDAYATIGVTDALSLLAHVDGGGEKNAIGTSGWIAGALSAKVQLTPKVYTAVRADYVREYVPDDRGTRAAPIFWPTPWVASGTMTLAVQPADVLSVRLELRHDQAKDRVYYGGNVAGDGEMTPYVANRRQQDTLTLGATAWF